jgi:hypothetical protein
MSKSNSSPWRGFTVIHFTLACPAPFLKYYLILFEPGIIAINNLLLSKSLLLRCFSFSCPAIFILVFIGSEYRSGNGEPKKQNMMDVSKVIGNLERA